MRPGKRRQLDPTRKGRRLLEEAEQLKASVRAKVEHPVPRDQAPVRHTKVRYRGLAKNTAQLFTLFALANLWMARKTLAVLDGKVRLKTTIAA